MLTFGKPPKHFSLQHDSTGVPTTQLLQSLETALPVLFHSVFVQNTLQQDVLAANTTGSSLISNGYKHLTTASTFTMAGLIAVK